MDGESSYESDISESWSLIDINLNEESVDENGLERGSNNVKLKRENEENGEDETATSRLSDSDLDSSLKIEELNSSERGGVYEIDEHNEVSLDDGSKNESCDAESIEILDEDDNRDLEIDKLEMLIVDKDDCDEDHNSDDEKNENVDFRRKCLTVIKRKRRKLSRDSDSSKDSIKSDCSSSSENLLSNDELITRDDQLKIFPSDSSSRPVYKHYRNNVANTVLSLSMGVIFAGVACIAIGHFLGVHDAGQTALELMGTLKKLQTENLALQSRLSHLDKAFISREINSKLENSQNEGYCNRKPPDSEPFIPSPGTSPSVPDSINRLSQLQNLIKTKSRCLTNDNTIDLNKIVTNIHDQLAALNSKKADNTKLKELEESDLKISKTLQKITDMLSSSRDNIEDLYQKLLKLNESLNKKLSKVLPGKNFCETEAKKARKPVTESDLQSLQWSSNLKNVIVFPQTEEYYKVFGNNVTEIIPKKTVKEVKQATSEFPKVNVSESLETPKTISKKVKSKEKTKLNKEKKRKQKTWSKYSIVEMEKKVKKKKVQDEAKQKQLKYLLTSKNFTKPYSKKDQKVKRIAKQVLKKFKHSGKNTKLKKTKRVFVARKNKRTRFCSKPEKCFNGTGHWVFKWADGRQESRKYQSQGDWQFDRARARREMRDEDVNLNWQFKRAFGRESNRISDKWSDDRIRYSRKGFLPDDYSWI